MDLEDILKKLKHLSPDEQYTAWSRKVVLSSLPAEKPLRNPWQILSHTFQFGSAVALAGVLLLLLLGGFSGSSLSPFKLTSLDPADLKAEAQAIDVQLEITRIQYDLPVEPALQNETTTAARATDPAALELKSQATAEAQNLGLPSPSSTEQASI